MGNELTLQKNKTIFNKGQDVNAIGIIMQGSVNMNHKYFSLPLKAGHMAGISHIAKGRASTTDITTEDTTLSVFPMESTFPDNCILKEELSLQKSALSTLRYQMNAYRELYAGYRESLKKISLTFDSMMEKYALLCERLHITKRVLHEDAPQKTEKLLGASPFFISYYMDINTLLEQYTPDFHKKHKDFFYGLILKASEDTLLYQDVLEKICDAIISYKDCLINPDYNDYFRCFSEFFTRTHAGCIEYEDAKELLEMLFSLLSGMPFVDQNALKERINDQRDKMKAMEESLSETDGEAGAIITNLITDSMNKILDIAKEDNDFVSAFTKRLTAYKKMPDKTINSPAATQLRRQLTEDFHRLYQNLSMKFLRGEPINEAVKLFLNFGYIDEDLAGIENAEMLCKLLMADISDTAQNIYTFPTWLKAIYDGKKEPSRNEFDMDYTDFLHAERVAGRLTANEEKEKLEDKEAKVLYELENFFPQANKMTFGHISSYCPFFSGHNIIDHLSKGLVNSSRLVSERENIRKCDYQIFYKEVVYSNPSIGVNAEFLHTEILPDIILMPNYGSRGIMWQEVEGKRRATPCRMVLPIFTPENLSNLFLHICGEYRWEMCKRMQGSRWNEPGSNCLTGDYFDYLQFYRKNNDLSPDMKDKIKTQLTKARNSIKEAFILDYMIWILYESDGAPRLNKVARSILFNHCPFPDEVRSRLSSNPIYLQVIQRHVSKYDQLSHRMNNLCQKLTNNGKPVPEEFLQEMKFFDK